MAGAEQELVGPELSGGIALSELREGEPMVGHLDGEQVLVTRYADEVRAVGASCTHYGGPLGEGLVTGETVRCPWHHACFSLRTGEAVAAPALNPLPWWDVEVVDGVVRLGDRHEESTLGPRGRTASGPDSIVILGAGAAGSTAAETLRREGYGGRIVLVDPDSDAPYDRPNLSKDYLAGSAPEEWIPLRPRGFYEDHGIGRIGERAVRIDRDRARLELESGTSVEYGALLLATGATPMSLKVPGADQPQVHELRSLADCRRIIGDVEEARHAVVIGAGFIGMEAGASLVARSIDVTVVAPEAVPFERTLGPELGSLLQREHERNGVVFHLGRAVGSIEADAVVLDDGTRLPADLVLVGIGVRPETELASAAGLEVDDGIVVDDRLRTSDPRIYAAGDTARWPDPRTGEDVRVEHWVVAQRQGQAAARNILERDEPFLDVPFFWTNQFGVGVRYVGHAATWDRVEVDGDPNGGDAAFRYLRGGRVLAVATVGRDQESLEAEVALSHVGGASPDARTES
jgi:NADPH-dependent 2,4-dienoyl-CoA reductase/sulfur reductase-like enzyme/nitrite reductase/ring-hydroxylating ferredoxin subunit